MRIRQNPIAAEFLVTILAPGQATPDAEMRQVEEQASVALQRAPVLPPGYALLVNKFGVKSDDPRCAACSQPVLDQIERAAAALSDAMSALETLNTALDLKSKRLREIIDAAKSAESAEDFTRWVAELPG